MRRSLELPTPADVFFDPVVQLAALCPICALAALRPEAAIAALAPGLVLFNPALNPAAASLSLALDPVVARIARRAVVGGRRGQVGASDWLGRAAERWGLAGVESWQGEGGERVRAEGGKAVFRSNGVVVRPGPVQSSSTPAVFRSSG